jgi:hypothetical protein
LTAASVEFKVHGSTGRSRASDLLEAQFQVALCIYILRGHLSETMSLVCKRLSAGLLSPSPLTRSVSTSPYGRSHVFKQRLPKLPNPVVPHFPQRVVRADGSSYMQWTTSPRSRIILTRDTTNHPLWNATQRLSGAVGEGGAEDEEQEGTGRLGRFKRRFGQEVGAGEWTELQEGIEAEVEPPLSKKQKATTKK